MSSDAQIAIEKLSKVYKQRNKPAVVAVDDLNLSVSAGQVLGFLGANGAGKTTTIKMICGLITPTTGNITVNGYSVARQRSMAMRQIGAVLEGTRNIYWRLSAWENLLYFGRLRGTRSKELYSSAERLLRELDLWERRHQRVRMFSRGMQQKVAIACALIADPPIVLLDEPTLGLDITASRTVKTWINKLAHEQGKIVILTTHQLDMAQELCDRIAIIREGHLLSDQPLSELLHLFTKEYYQIKVGGLLSDEQATYFDSLVMQHEDDTTLLTGSIASQATLHSHLTQLQKLQYPLLSVMRTEPSLEEVFMQLTTTEKKGVIHEEYSISYK